MRNELLYVLCIQLVRIFAYPDSRSISALGSHSPDDAPEGANSCRLEDRVEYELPLGFIGSLFGGWFVDKKLRKLFLYRDNVAAEAFAGRDSKKGVSPEVA